MTRYLVKQAYRACLVQVKNYFGIIAAMLALATLGCYTLFPQIYHSSFYLPDWIFKLALGCSALGLIVLLLGKRPPFIIHPATIHFFSDTSAFGRIKAFALVKKAVGLFLLTGIVGITLCRFEFSELFAGFLLCYSLYFVSLSLVRWFGYNTKKPALTLIIYAVSTASFLLNAFYGAWYFAVAQALIIVALVFMYFRLDIDLSRYYEDSLYYERINNASRHRDMAVMQQITADHIANKRRVVKLGDLPLNKNNALFYKALIETLRMSKQVAVILLALLAFAILINTTSLFSSVPFIGEPFAARVIGMFSLTAFLTNLKELYLKQFLSVTAKQREGLFLPFKKSKVVLNYLLICCAVAVAAVVAAGLALCASPINVILSAVIMLIGVNLAFWGKKGQVMNVVSNTIIFTAAHFLFR